MDAFLLEKKINSGNVKIISIAVAIRNKKEP